MDVIVQQEIGSILNDEGLVEYVVGMLSDAPEEAESSEAVVEFLSSASDPPLEEAEAASVTSKLFAALRAAGFGESAPAGPSSSAAAGGSGATGGAGDGAGGGGETTRLLTTKVKMGDNLGESTSFGTPGDDGNFTSKGTHMGAGIVSMRDQGNPLEATSMRALRKQAQERKKFARRQQLAAEAKAFELAIKHELALAASGGGAGGGGDGAGGGGGNENEDDDEDGEYGSAAHSSRDVHLRGFDVDNKRGAGQLLIGADLSLAAGRRYGLVGRNGCGKTTFLELMAQREVPGVPSKMTLLLVKQEIVGTAVTSMECVLKSDARREALCRAIDKIEREQEAAEAELKTTTGGVAKEKLVSAAERCAAALHPLYERRAVLDDVKGAPVPRARKVLSGLGFSEAMLDQPTASLSGGWRMRVSLACALFAEPELLLLDEPTNHLDLEAVLWLESYLTESFKGILLVVSHDRSFLNEVVTDVVLFKHQTKTLKVYKGDVTNFEAVHSDEVLRQKRQHELQEEKQKHLIKNAEFLGGANMKAAKQRKSKLKKLDRVGVGAAQDGKKWKMSDQAEAAEVVEAYVEEAPVVLDFPDPGPFDHAIVRITNASFAYEPKAKKKPKAEGAEGSDEDESESDGEEGEERKHGDPKKPPPPPPTAAEATAEAAAAAAMPNLLSNVDFQVTSKSRIALLGRNGCGKSTLIKLMVGQLRPNRGGECLVDGSAKIEYVAQHQLEQLDGLGTPLSTMLEKFPGNGSNQYTQSMRSHLARFGLGGEVLPVQKIHTLSGGQKCRVCLAAAMYRRPHLLILDEPTNHLDMETTDALVEAIKNFQGGVVVVSHDQHLLATACEELWAIHKGEVQRWDDSFAKYKKDVVAGRR